MRERIFTGSAYSIGDSFNVSTSNHPLTYVENLELILDAFVNPSPGTLAAIESWKNGNHRPDKIREVEVVRYIDRPIYHWWTFVKIWWTGKWPS